jgi:carboxyl-terminal processing protease
VKQSYNSDEDVYQALQVMLQKIGDKYTRYLPPNQYNTIMNSALGELCGVGVELELTANGGVKIINIQPDSPAAESGLRIGDLFVNVDGSDARTISAEEVAALLR